MPAKPEQTETSEPTRPLMFALHSSEYRGTGRRRNGLEAQREAIDAEAAAAGLGR